MHILDFFHYFLSFFFFTQFCFIPFTDRLKQKKRNIILESALFCAVLSAIPIVLNEKNYSGAMQIVSVAFYFGFFFFYKKTVQDGTQKLLFVTFMAVHSLCMGTELEFAVVTLAGAFPLPLPTPAAWYALFIPMRIVLYLVVGFIMHRILTPRLREIKNDDMKGLPALPVVFAAISIYRGAEYHYTAKADPVYPFIFLGLAVASFFVYWQMLRILDSVVKNARLEMEKEKLTMETEFYHKMSHDLLTPLTVVSTNIQVADSMPDKTGDRLKQSQKEIMKMSEMINAALKGGDDE